MDAVKNVIACLTGCSCDLQCNYFRWPSDHELHEVHILELIDTKGYRVCYRERDLGTGVLTERVASSIERSKRTVCYRQTF